MGNDKIDSYSNYELRLYVASYEEKAWEYIEAGEYSSAAMELLIAMNFICSLDKHSLLNPGEYSVVLSNIYYMYGECNFLLEDYKSAISDYTESIKLKPMEVTYLRRAESHSRMGHLKEAIEDLTGLITLNPYQPSLYSRRGSCYQDAGLDQMATRDFLRAENINPQPQKP